jgi:hypothetical protein
MRQDIALRRKCWEIKVCTEKVFQSFQVTCKSGHEAGKDHFYRYLHSVVTRAQVRAQVLLTRGRVICPSALLGWEGDRDFGTE